MDDQFLLLFWLIWLLAVLGMLAFLADLLHENPKWKLTRFLDRICDWLSI